MKNVFKQVSACHIAKGNRAKKDHTPPPATTFIVCSYKNEQKQIKRYPEVGDTQVRHYTVKERIALVIIYLNKKPLVPLF